MMTGNNVAGGRQSERRFKRQSAPDELLFTLVVGTAESQEPLNPPLCSVRQQQQLAHSVSKTADDPYPGLGTVGGGGDFVVATTGPSLTAAGPSSIGKSKNWLTRISRSLTSTNAYRSSSPGGSGGTNSADAVLAGACTPPTSPPVDWRRPAVEGGDDVMVQG